MPSVLRFTAASLPADLCTQVWRGEELGRVRSTVSSGHDALDRELPGGGWPAGGMVELLQGPGEQPVWQLLMPALAQAVRAQPGPVVLVGAPFQPFAPALAAQGLPADRLLCVRAGPPAARLWSTEQALRCTQVAAVLAWLPQARHPELRRLHLAAQQHDRLLFVFRAERVKSESSPARLRLLIEASDPLRIHVLKRQGPPATGPVLLPARADRLAAWLASRRGRIAKLPAGRPLIVTSESHVLDRPVALP